MVEALQRAAVVGVAQHRARREKLVQRQSAMKDIAAQEAELPFEIEWREDLPADHAFRKAGRISLDGRDHEIGDFLAMIERYRVTHTFLPPTLIYMLLQHEKLATTDRGSLQCFWYGAAPISPARLEEAIDKIGPVMAQLFGQTEAPMMISMMAPRDHFNADGTIAKQRLSSAGRPGPLVQVATIGDHRGLELGRMDGAADPRLDHRVGRERTVVVLTADHGSQPLVESLQARGQDARRVPSKFLEAKFTQAFARRFPGAQGLLPYWSPPNFYLDEAVIRRLSLRTEEVAATVAEVLRESGLAASVYTKADFLKSVPLGDPYFELFRNSFFEPRSGHVVALLKPSVFLGARTGGASHGTPYEHDRHVPLLFFGAGIKPGRHDEPCGPEDIAPTLARLLGFDYPRESDARLLSEILPPPSPPPDTAAQTPRPAASK